MTVPSARICFHACLCRHVRYLEFPSLAPIIPGHKVSLCRLQHACVSQSCSGAGGAQPACQQQTRMSKLEQSACILSIASCDCRYKRDPVSLLGLCQQLHLCLGATTLLATKRRRWLPVCLGSVLGCASGMTAACAACAACVSGLCAWLCQWYDSCLCCLRCLCVWDVTHSSPVMPCEMPAVLQSMPETDEPDVRCHTAVMMQASGQKVPNLLYT